MSRVAFQERIECVAVASKQHTDVAAARTGRFVDEAVDHRCIRQFPVASIEYAEIVVNTELAQHANIRDVLCKHLIRVARAPRIAHPRRSQQERRTRRSGCNRGQPGEFLLRACGHACPDHAVRETFRPAQCATAARAPRELDETAMHGGRDVHATATAALHVTMRVHRRFQNVG